jgi:ketosteroid isomerase-like protein
MGAALDVIQQAYAAYGRQDIPAVLSLVGDQVDWEFVGPPSLSYAGHRTTPEQVAVFFSELASADDIQVFEPREFIEAGEHVTVLGWGEGIARETQVKYKTEWAHVFTVKDGKVVRWRGFSDTASRYPH